MSVIPFSESPFDSIKKIRPDGSEFWTGRELMGVMGYARWENFDSAVERAKMAAQNQGTPSQLHFRGVTKKGFIKSQADYELTRYAAYLVAMNGDPRKPEIAAAQSYFAIRTREAETAKTPNISELVANPDLLIQLATSLKEEKAGREIAEAKVQELTPAATSFEHWKADDEGMSRRELCNKIREIYPQINEARLREHMLKRRELVKKMRANGEHKLVPSADMYTRGFAIEYKFHDQNGKVRTGHVWTLAYYEELLKRLAKTYPVAGQQELLAVA